MIFETGKNNLLHRIFKGNNTLYKLILINVLVFVAISLIRIIIKLFDINWAFYEVLQNNLYISSEPMEVLEKPWTLLTYMFMHAGILHILFNMLWLYWFGKIFMDYLYKRKLLVTYFLGGLSGALVYILAYQFIPYLQDKTSLMVGASASVVAIIVSTATLLPNYQVSLLFFGSVKLKYIAIIMVVIDVLSLEGNNIGGSFAHLGGALYGFIYILQLKKGRDLGAWLSHIIDFFVNTFQNILHPTLRKRPFKVYHTETKTNSPSPQKKQSVADQKVIDNILDKIAKSGYESLSDKEKDILFNASKK